MNLSTDQQTSLFTDRDRQAIQQSQFISPAANLSISATALQAWKQRIYHYQQQIRTQPPPEQGSLFQVPETAPDAGAIAPFDLPQQNTEFWRWKASDVGVAAMYFVIDYELPILLYVGETVKSNQRWKGEHDCKRYLLNYVAAHRPHRLSVAVNIAFWGQAPVERKARQALESELIYQWRSPFNKENWQFWGTPFVGE